MTIFLQGTSILDLRIARVKSEEKLDELLTGVAVFCQRKYGCDVPIASEYFYQLVTKASDRGLSQFASNLHICQGNYTATV